MGRLTEQPPTFQQKFDAVKKQMVASSKAKKKFTEAEMDILVKKSIIDYANDKIDFSLRGALRRGRHKKLGMSEEEFTIEWNKKQKSNLAKLGFSFAFSKEESLQYETLLKKLQEEAIEEKTKMTAQALKKILTSA